jgi:sterol desaturase/sphingolipid hydroxylase (fatty acid hydroxylase superfamily)
MNPVALSKEALGWAVFPLLVTGALGGAAAALARGVPSMAVVVATSAGSALALFALERVIPFSRTWSRSRGDVLTDVMHLVVSMIVVPELARAMLSVRAPIWPTTWPLPLQFVLALLVSELGQYAWHRFAHESAIGWRFHAIHHSAPRLYWLNAARFHPLESLLTYFMSAGLLALLGVPHEVFTLYVVFTSLNGMLKHCNVDLHLGPLNYIVSCAELHRWHHSRALDEANANYGSNLIVWDLVFGTFRWDRERTPPEDVGLANMARFPTHYAGHLLSPFRRQKALQSDPRTPPRVT